MSMQVAMFWAMEEANSPTGWDEERELDYAEASRRREEQSVKEGMWLTCIQVGSQGKSIAFPIVFYLGK